MPAAVYTIAVQQARYLTETEWLTKQDPYCQVWTTSTKERKNTTKTIKDGGKSAVWNETFELTVADDNTESIFLLVVNENDILKDKEIGKAKFLCSDIHETPVETWIRIYSPNGADAGEVQIQASLKSRGSNHEVHESNKSLDQRSRKESNRSLVQTNESNRSLVQTNERPVVTVLTDERPIVSVVSAATIIPTTPTATPTPAAVSPTAPVSPTAAISPTVAVTPTAPTIEIPVLPAGWTAATDPNTNRTYYANQIKHTTQWELPTHPADYTAPEMNTVPLIHATLVEDNSPSGAAVVYAEAYDLQEGPSPYVRQPSVQHVQASVQHVQPSVQHVQASVQHVQPSISSYPQQQSASSIQQNNLSSYPQHPSMNYYQQQQQPSSSGFSIASQQSQQSLRDVSPEIASLPPAWSQKIAPDGRPYYYNHISNITTWDRP